jgi:peptidoglycan hydrolase-like protein with peptidoglycan-binding domain
MAFEKVLYGEIRRFTRNSATMNIGPTLAIGSSGPDVRRLQRILVMIKLLNYTGIDGIFGPQTRLALESFQQRVALLADGLAGPETWAKLPPDPSTPELSFGAGGKSVQALQQALFAYGGSGSRTDPGPIDGDFGPQTEAAVRAYQKLREITADGIVGDQTWWVPAGAAGATLASLAELTTAYSST